MGISDREYLRVGPRSTSGLGSLRFVSVNTWIIAINVAVFVIANIIFAKTLIRQDVGRVIQDGVTLRQSLDAVVLRDVQRPIPNLPGYFAQVLVDKSTRQQIGIQRVTYRPIVEGFGHFSTGKGFRELEVWRFVTFQFLHAGWVHLAFNMLGLWFVGGLVEQYLGRRLYLAFYLASGVFGAVGYLTLNFLGYLITTFGSASWIGRVPGLLFQDQYTPLVGASAGVFGVLMAAAFIAPRSMVDILGVIPARLRTAVYIFLGAAVVNLVLGGDNAGGDAAHVAGAFAGAFFIRHKHLLRDFFEVFGSPSKKVKSPSPGPISSPKLAQQADMDRILAKVSNAGLASLSDAERATLRKATDEQWRSGTKPDGNAAEAPR